MTRLSKAFNDFVPTILSRENFREIEKAAGVQLTPKIRTTIQRYLSRYEYDVALRRAGVGPEILKIVEKLGRRLDEIVKLARELEEIPGDVWAEMANRAGSDAQTELERLDALVCAKEIILEKKRHRGDFAFELLLKNVAQQFEASGLSVRVSKRTGGRESKFAKFMAGCLKCLPVECQVNEEAIAARWERIRATLRRSNKKEGRSWLGKPPALAALLQDWYWPED